MRKPARLRALATLIFLGCTPAAAVPEPTPAVIPPPPPEPVVARAPAPTPAPAPAPARAREFVDDPALTLSVAARINTGVQPKSVAASPDGRQLWVCNFGYSGRKNVYVYDSATLERVGVATFAGNAVEVGFAPDSSRAYVSNFARGVVEIIDARSFELIGETDELGLYPKVIAVAPDGARIYVANWGSDDVAVVDADSFALVERFAAGNRPRGMAVAADGTLFVNAMWDHLVHVFGPAGAAPPIPTCQHPRHAVFDRANPALFVSCSGDDRLRWHDPADGRVLGEVAVGDNPRSFGLSDDGRWAATANFDASSVTLVDLYGGRVRTTAIPKTDRLVGLALARGPQLRVFATSWGNHQLVELRPAETASDAAEPPQSGEERQN